MWTQTIVFVLALAFTGAVSAAPSEQSARESQFPQPAALDQAVAFWTRVYTEVDYNSGFIHDNRHLNIVYKTYPLRPQANWRSQRKAVRKEIKRYRRMLRSLAAGKRKGLSREEQRILELWGEDVTARELKAAAKRVRFQRGQGDQFREGLVRAGAWEDKIRKILARSGLPQELAALPHVESSYNPWAKSHAGAAGLWQLMRSTGRRYLRVDHVVDERMDPMMASEAAARLLQHNYSVLKSWPLAITAYNHGLSGVRRAVRKTGSEDIGVIVERYNGRRFGFASRNFYAAFLAALAVSEEPERYFGEIPRERPTDYLRIASPAYFPVDALVDALGVDRETLKTLNPAVQRSVWKGAKFFPKDYEMRLPPDLDPEHTAEELQLAALQHGFAGQRPDRFYKVRRGDSLSVIAKRYNTSVNNLMAMNNLRSRHRIRVGQRLRLPDFQAPQPLSLQAATAMKAVYREGAGPATYQVRKGDTISEIARRFGVDERDFLAANQIRNPNLLYAGQVLRIPGQAQAEVTSVAATSADLQLAKIEQAGDIPESRAREPETAAPARSEPAGQQRSEAIDTSAQVAEGLEPTGDLAPADEASAAIGDLASVSDDPERVGDPTLTDAGSEAIGDSAQLADESEPAGDLAPNDEEPDVVSDSVPVEPQPALSADPADYKVAADASIEVQAAETLGHYAEWLDIRARQLRRLNGLRFGKPLVIGRRLTLDFSKVDREVFEQRRLEHHQALQTRYFDRHHIVATRTHRVTSGDSLWLLATREYRIPLWLLRQYNPDVEFGTLPPGVTLSIPVVEKLDNKVSVPATSTAST